MTVKINREKFIQLLDSVFPGIAPREIVEQSTSFVFQKGSISSFNDETSCRAPSPLPEDFTGAVPAKPLLEILGKLTEDELRVECSDSELVFVGKRRRAGIRIEKDIALPLDSVEPPGDWRELPEEFGEAVAMVQACAGQDESQQALVCVHIAPKWVEACDNFQLCRWRLATGFEKPTLVRQSAIKHVTGLGMMEVAESAGWVHFRNAAGLVLSCRRYLEDYPSLAAVLKAEKGEAISLPKGLAEEADKAEIFSKENADANHLLIDLSAGKLKVAGTGVSGWYRATRKVVYAGPPLRFLIAPGILRDLVRKHSDCLVSPTQLRVEGGSYSFVSCLFQPQKEDGDDTGTPEVGEAEPEGNGEEEAPRRKGKKAAAAIAAEEEGGEE